ncbi:MAG: SDR family oxidoreductase [Acidimicrobiia bacterium]|nr:SDR family oxidoreductase [Acidimicrobiia bacterium]MYG70951.1 SDR family oxidoreductase [Acidimicrobiia bacterium]
MGMVAPVADLTGAIVVVAGAGGGGIGTCSCEAALAAGAEVVAVERSPEELDKLDTLLRPVVKVQADLTAPDAPAAVVQAALDAHGRIDGLINVAGGTSIDDFGPLVDIDSQSWDRVMANNLHYVAFLNRAVARTMIDAGTGGAMVNVSSVSSLASQPFLAAYGAAKAGINSLTRTMAVEWGGHGIRVNAIAPGTITTPRVGDHESLEAAKRAIPLGRRGHPAEIAAAAAFLLSPQASYITGQVLAVDGGMSVKLAMLGDDNAPVFVTRPEVRARMFGTESP